ETGLVGYWQFDEGTGQTTADSSAAGNHGTLGVDANAGDDDPTWIDSSLWSPLKNLEGTLLDGEYAGSFPSGNGTAGGDFSATFTVDDSNAPPRVVALSPAPGATLDTPPSSVTLTFSKALDSDTVDAGVFRLLRSGNDGNFTSGNEVLVTPNAVTLVTPTNVVMDLTGTVLPSDDYQVLVAQADAGSALRFSGNRGTPDQTLVQIPDSSSLYFVTGMTVEVWTKPGPYNNVKDEHLVSQLQEGPSNYIGFDLSRNGQGVSDSGTRFELCDNGSWASTYHHTQLKQGVWQHVAGVYDTSTVKIYIDGVERASSAVTAPAGDASIPLWIGNWYCDNGRPYNGVIDEVRLWNTPRSGAQIQAGMCVGLTGTEPGLVGYWKFDEGSGQIVNDSSGDGNHGTLGRTANAEADDPEWIASTLWGGVRDEVGNALDGEYAGFLPSGDGNAGGDFAATFTLGVPGTPPSVVALSPEPGANPSTKPLEVRARFSKALDSNTVDRTAFRLLRSGGDGVFGNGNDVAVEPRSVTLTSATEARMDLSGIELPDDLYKVTLSASGAGSALKFSGQHGSSTQDRVEVNDSPSLHFTNALTIEMWLKPGEYNNAHDEVFLSHVTMVNNGYMVGRNAAASPGRWFFLQQNTSPLGVCLTDGQQLSLGVWHHIAAVLDTTTIYLYVDGILTATATEEAFDMAQANSGMPLWLGNYPPDGGRPYNGEMDEVRLWNVARTADEIHADMYRALAGSENGLVGYWRFDEGSGQVANDASGTGNTGTLGVGSAVDASDPLWIASSLWGPIRDSLGTTLDGEYAGTFPSGDGTAGGDFVAMFTIGTLNEDSDGDSLPDSWEQQIIAASGGSLTSVWQVLPADDFDGDGVSNVAEYLAGTDPTDSSSYPTVSLVISGNPGAFGQSAPVGYGTNLVKAGMAVTASVTSPAYPTNGVQYTCTGWIGTGSVPASGSATNVSFSAGSDSTLTWQWAAAYYLDTTAAANGTVSPADGWHAANTNVQVTATAASNHHFSYWTGDVPAGMETANPLSVTMDRPRQLTANFAASTFTIVAAAGANGAISPSGTQSVSSGANITFTLTPAANYHVSQVLIDGISIGAPTTYTFGNVTASHTISASFAANTCSVCGRVYYFGPQAGPIYVEVYDGANATNCVRSTQIAGPGPYTVGSLPAGADYWVRAFLDSNTNAVRNAMEPAGDYAQNPLTNLVTGASGVDITLQRLSAPQNVTACGAVDCIVLRWNPNPEQGVYGYNVYRFDRYWGQFDKLTPNPVTGLTYSDYDVAGGEVHYYYVTAVIKSAFLPSYLESPASSIVSASANSIALWMPDYFGMPGSTVRLRINASDARGVLGKDMDIRVLYDPAVLTPLTQIDTNEPTVERTVLTSGLTVTDNGATANGEIQIATSDQGGASHATLKILGCGYASSPNHPVPIEAAYSTDGGSTWTGIKNLKDVNDGARHSVDLGVLAAATDARVYVKELYEGHERRSDEPGPYVCVARNGDSLAGIPGLASADDLAHYLKPYVDEDLTVTIGADDVLYLFELSNSTNGPAADYQDVAVLVAFNEGAGLVGHGHLFDVLFQVAPAAALGAVQTNSFSRVTLYDQAGTPLSVDYTDTALLTVSNCWFLGDVNGDGTVDVSGDFTLAMKLAVGQREPTALELAAGDIDGDAAITKADATLIHRLALGLPLNPQPPSSGGGAPVPAEEGGYEIAIGNAEAQAGAVVQVAVTIDNAEDVAALRLSLNYDPDLLTLQSITNAPLTAGFALEYLLGDGTAEIVLCRETGLLSGSGEILLLSFLVAAGAEPGAYSDLTLARRELGDEHGGDLAWSAGISESQGSFWVVLSAAADTDADGLSDYAEQTYDGSPAYNPFDPAANPGGTDTAWNKADTDGDGRPDGFEQERGTSPTDPTSFAVSVANDYDGDGKTDLALYYPANGGWYLLMSTDGFAMRQFGWNGPRPVPADYDGDTKADLALYFPPNGTWYLMRSSAGFRTVPFGWDGPRPVPGDYDGDGKVDLGLYYGPNGTWYLLMTTAGFSARQFGWDGPTPVPGDYDGDGKTDLALYFPPNGTWYLMMTSGGFAARGFGWDGPLPVPGDYDGDGKTDLALYFPPNGTWYLMMTSGGFSARQFGWDGPVPVPGDYDGDGKTDLALYFPPNGTWYLMMTSDGFTSRPFGWWEPEPMP
ncbi:MAG: Ig-like domain-containing protein, partial [Kiritimatiellae bacterium]|nr:Ig-like domain-containing protein [Kiritimatiellia bacterium]